jgi:hypothetical protein
LEVVTEIQECPSSMLEMSMVGSLGGDARDLRGPTINTKNVNSRPPGPWGGSGLHLGSERCVVTYIGMIDKK